MRNAFSTLLFAGALLLAGCSGGGSSSSSSLRIPCIGGQSFCVISCDLGCSQTGCSVTEIAENQRLRFKFSDAVATGSVTGASISIRTATGVAPAGDFVVSGNEVTFVPKVTTANGVSSFGFRRNETYVISLSGGRSIAQSVTNLAGDGLSQEFSCSVVASLGILDEDQQPPSVELISPTVLVGAPANPTIVLRFSELIDTTPLQVSLGDASPIRVVLRSILPSGECDADSDGTPLTGVPQLSTEQFGQREVSVVTFQAENALPGNSCITVRVTSDLRDLSGRSSVPAKFEFLTEAGVSQPIEITESFVDNSQQEIAVSGGVWGGAGGGARPGLVGGDGRHGSFSTDLGQVVASSTYAIDVDNTIIPANQSLTGLEYQVTDGRFFFTDFIVPEGTTIRFVGTVAPVLRVRGIVDIRGHVEVNGISSPAELQVTGPANGQMLSTFDAREFSPPAQVVDGQPGTLGGAGGAAGGTGGKEGNDGGPEFVNGVNINQGQAGDNVQVRASHAYAGLATATGGMGSAMTPQSGMWAAVPPKIGTIYCSYFSAGGGGGGYSGPGAQADVPLPVNGTQTIVSEPLVNGGVAFSLLPYPPVPLPPNYSSLDHFTVGGSGGGGGGSHGYGLLAVGAAPERWMAGHGGTGGGGALAIRCGGALAIAATASVEARGGDGCVINGTGPNGASAAAGYGVSSPGGGGSGGSILLQSSQNISIAGNLNARGGLGCRAGFIVTNAVTMNGKAGDGADGFFRLEAPGSGVAFGGTSSPPYVAGTNSGDLSDRDDLSGDTSLWYSADRLFPPTWQRYELDVDIDGDGIIDTVYTDSGEPGTMKAAEPSGPITLPLIIRFQGVNLDSNNIPIDAPGPWRDGIGSGAGPGIGLDAVTGFRFTITYNRALFPNLVVRGLRVLAQS